MIDLTLFVVCFVVNLSGDPIGQTAVPTMPSESLELELREDEAREDYLSDLCRGPDLRTEDEVDLTGVKYEYN